MPDIDIDIDTAMKWLVCVAEGDREGFTFNEWSAMNAAAIQREIKRLRAIISDLLDALKVTRLQLHVALAGKDALSIEKQLSIVEVAIAQAEAAGIKVEPLPGDMRVEGRTVVIYCESRQHAETLFASLIEQAEAIGI
jgi:signal transduction histidine kinase